MHIFVATRETQGAREDDFSWTVDGELVCFPVGDCDCAECGCQSAFVGLASAKGTTTALVVDHPELDRAAYRAALRDGLLRQHLIDQGDRDDEAWVNDLTDRQLTGAAAVPAGGIVDIRHGMLCIRSRVP